VALSAPIVERVRNTDFTANHFLYSSFPLLIGRDRQSGESHLGDQLAVDVVVVLDGDLGSRLAQAASAFWTDALLVLSVVDVVELAAVDPPGNVTPWSLRQLR
jgi:hypothetical protein